MDKYYLFSKKVTHAVKVSITLVISLLLFAFSQAAVGHESGYSPTGANAPNSIATNVDVGINKLAPALIPLTIKVGVKPVAVYNGTTAYTIDFDAALDGDIVLGDDVSLTEITGTFTDKKVGDGKTFTITSYELEGVDAAKYVLSQTSIVAEIKPIELTVSGITIDDKVYDGTTTAKLNYSTAVLAGPIILADNIKLLKLKPVGTFNSKVAGEKSVTITGFGIGDVIFSNDNHDNYILNILPLTANITKKPLTVSATCVDKVFDATTTATVSLTDNRVDGDVLAIAKLGASFATDHAGTTIPVTVEGISISGVDAANYSFNETASTTANITPKVITISGVTAIEKVYDDNNNAVLGGTATLVGVREMKK